MLSCPRRVMSADLPSASSSRRVLPPQRVTLCLIGIVLVLSPLRALAAYEAADVDQLSAAVPSSPSPEAPPLVETIVDQRQAASTASGLTVSVGLVGAGSLLDETLYNAARAGATPARDAFFGIITHLGDGLVTLALTAALWPHDRETAQLLGHAGLRTGLATVTLKSVISRARPYEEMAGCVDHRIDLGSCVSMPSGHTATAFSMARVLAHQYPEQRWLWYGLALLVGWSRVETGNHWPSDVVAGALLGLWAADSVLEQNASRRAPAVAVGTGSENDTKFLPAIDAPDTLDASDAPDRPDAPAALGATEAKGDTEAAPP